MTEDKLSNFIPISRKIFEHGFWNEKRVFSPFEAWIDIIQTARYEEKPMIELINGQNVSFGRGQLIGSVRFLKKRWNWGSTTKVTKFIAELETDNMISCNRSQGVTVITICKYDTYNKIKVEVKPPMKRKTNPKPKSDSKLAIASLTVEDSKLVYNSIKQYFLEIYQNEYKTDYYFQPRDASKIYDILKKVHFKMMERKNMAYSPAEVINGAQIFLIGSIKNADVWLKANYSLSTVDSKFNEIFSNLKNPQNAVAKHKSGTSTRFKF